MSKEVIVGDSIEGIQEHLEEFSLKTRWVNSYADLLSSVVTTVIHHRLNHEIYNLDSYNALCLTLKTCIMSTFTYLPEVIENHEDKVNRIANVLTIKLAHGKFSLSLLIEIMRILREMLLKHLIDVDNDKDKYIKEFANEDNIIDYVMHRYNLYYKMENDVFFVLDNLEVDSDEVINNINTLAGIVDNENDYFIDNDRIDGNTFFIELLHKEDLTKIIKIFRLTITLEDTPISYHIEELEVSETMLAYLNKLRYGN